MTVLRLGILIMTLLCTSVSVASPKFRLVTENFPPYNFSKNNRPFEHSEAQITGICTEIVQAVFARAGFEYSLKLREWDYAYNYARRKPYRGVFGTSFLPERESLFSWVGPLIQNDWVLFSRSDFKETIESEADIKKYKIGAYKGDVRSEYLKKMGYNVSELPNDYLNPIRLKEGLIDLWVSGGYSASFYAKAAGVTDIKPVYVLKEVPLYLAMHPDTKKEDIKALQSALDQLVSEGRIEQIVAQYK